MRWSSQVAEEEYPDRLAAWETSLAFLAKVVYSPSVQQAHKIYDNRFELS